MKILLATWNKRKVAWLSKGFASLECEVRSINGTEVIEIEKTGATCAENALLKVHAVGAMPETIIIGEDSALSVDALNGFPGDKTARWSPGTDDDRSAKLLQMLNDVPESNRSAQFKSAIAILFPDGTVTSVVGELQGFIAMHFQSREGFGYQRIFVRSDGKPVAHSDQVTSGDHRDKAMTLAICEIQKWMQIRSQ